MADFTEGDADVLYLDLLAPALIALIFGLMIHSFIIGVNVNDWWKGRSVTSIDHIVTCLGISRFCAHCANTLFLFGTELFLHSPDSHVTLIIVDEAHVFFTYANIWLTSLLSIFFCLKISNLHSRLFLYLRGLIVHRTLYFIVASVLLSILNCSTHFPLNITDVTKGRTYNKTMHCIYVNSIYSFTGGAVLPLFFYYISSVLLFISLYHHTTKMKMSKNLTINLETYYSAMRFVSFTFLYNTIYFIAHFVCAFYYYFYCVILLWLYAVLDLFPVLHSSYLIYRTAKLRNQMTKILQNIVDFLFQRTETRENIEVM